MKEPTEEEKVAHDFSYLKKEGLQIFKGTEHMNEIKEIDAIINLYKDDVCDGLRNKLMAYINSYYIAKEKVKGLSKQIEGMGFVKENSDITQEYQSVFLDGYNQAIEEAVSEINKAVDDLVGDLE